MSMGKSMGGLLRRCMCIRKCICKYVSAYMCMGKTIYLTTDVAATPMSPQHDHTPYSSLSAFFLTSNKTLPISSVVGIVGILRLSGFSTLKKLAATAACLAAAAAAGSATGTTAAPPPPSSVLSPLFVILAFFALSSAPDDSLASPLTPCTPFTPLTPFTPFASVSPAFRLAPADDSAGMLGGLLSAGYGTDEGVASPRASLVSATAASQSRGIKRQHDTTTPRHHNTTTPQHHNTTTPQHHNTTTPQHHNTTTPQHHTTTPRVHDATIPHHHSATPRHATAPPFASTFSETEINSIPTCHPTSLRTKPATAPRHPTHLSSPARPPPARASRPSHPRRHSTPVPGAGTSGTRRFERIPRMPGSLRGISGERNGHVLNGGRRRRWFMASARIGTGGFEFEFGSGFGCG
jgi:hypothetical protein